jgi:nitrous oxidase accessory protein
MTIGVRPHALLAAALLVLAGLGGACAATLEVGPDDRLDAAIVRAAPGDTLHLAPGVHRGGIVLDKPGLRLEGAADAIVDGADAGSTITVTAPDVAIRGIAVRNSGLSLIDKNSGIFLDRTADRAVVEDVVLTDNLIGVYLDGTHDALVRHVTVHGLHTLRRTERGPSVSIWNAPGSRILDSELEGGRDGVFSVASRHNTISGNRLHGLRFAIHFMYTNDSEVADNISVGNDVGYVMMYSDRLWLHDNISDGDRDNGLLFNYANSAAIVGNVVRGSEKCVFIYNANKNRFSDNWFESCSVGVHFTAGSERNTISGNSFVANRTQVMYVGTRSLDWASEGRGNYWSDNPAFDLNGDGIADTAYRPNDIIDQVIWRAPAAKLLLNSPAVQVVRWAQARFPAIHPGGVLDSAPLMRPVRPPALSELGAAR